MNVSKSIDNFNNVNVTVDNLRENISTPSKINKTKLNQINVKTYLIHKTIDEIVKKNYNEYKQNKKNVNKIYKEWVNPSLHIFNDINLNKCTCKNCGNIIDIDSINEKKKTSYF